MEKNEVERNKNVLHNEKEFSPYIFRLSGFPLHFRYVWLLRLMHDIIVFAK